MSRTNDCIFTIAARRRLGRAEEVTALITFLASDDASWVSGSYHLVDGGFTAQ